MPDALTPRVDLLERLATQQLTLNDHLIRMTTHLGHALVLSEERQVRHDEAMVELRAILAALRDLLVRSNAHAGGDSAR
jgi:hypothetical protein